MNETLELGGELCQFLVGKSFVLPYDLLQLPASLLQPPVLRGTVLPSTGLFTLRLAALCDDLAHEQVIGFSVERRMGGIAHLVQFPCELYRNRLIAGLALGTLVVEAGEKSGSLQTAHHALDEGRTVMALPGRVDTDTARGPNALIREGAVLVRDARDIFDEFAFALPEFAPKAKTSALDPRRALDVSGDERKVLAALWKERELPVDEVIRATGIPAAQLLPLVLRMEMKRLGIRRKPLYVVPNNIVEQFRKEFSDKYDFA